MRLRATRCARGICSAHTLGMGMSHTAKSVVMLTMAKPMAKFLKSMHEPLPVQKALMGMHSKMAMSSDTTPQRATRPPVA